MAGKAIATGRARATFLAALEETCNVTGSARTAGFDPSTAYRWRAEDATFAEAWDQALEAAADKLEEVAFERAKAGLSDRMLEILLKAHRPKYREKQAVEISGGITVDHAMVARQEVADIFGPTSLQIEAKNDG